MVWHYSRVKEGMTYYNCSYYTTIYIYTYVCFIEAHQFLVYFDNVYTSMKSLK